MTSATLWRLAHGRKLELGAKAVIMGVLNVTPDSFSDGGRYGAVDAAVARARTMAAEGAAIIDIGGESTRPGATPVDAEEEQRRILPVIEALAADPSFVLSVDTYRAETARLAVAAGVHIVNDIWGLHRDPAIARLAVETGAGLVVMHNSRDRQTHADPIEDQKLFLTESLSIARTAGVDDQQIVLDPGFGFGKNAAENLALISRFGELAELGRPWLVGTSRKRFLGEATGRPTEQRDVATAATSAMLRAKGAAVFRVHDVATNKDALAVVDAMLARRRESRGMAAMYVIRMKNCAFFARHGVLDEEEMLGQRFYVDAVLTVDPGQALENDEIAGTVDYGVAFQEIEKIVMGRRRFLIEALALDVAKSLAQRFPQITRSEITVRKPNAPVPGVLDHVEVTIVWPG